MRASRRDGQSIVELVTALIVIIPMMLAVLDCTFVFIGASLNDFVCRDAARAAASGPPSQLTTGDNRTVGMGDPAGLPGFSKPITFTFHNRSQWENVSPDPLTGAYYINE